MLIKVSNFPLADNSLPLSFFTGGKYMIVEHMLPVLVTVKKNRRNDKTLKNLIKKSTFNPIIKCCKEEEKSNLCC